MPAGFKTEHAKNIMIYFSYSNREICNFSRYKWYST